MIVLDTNVLSELMRDNPDAKVFAWIDARADSELFLTAITAAEIYYGITRLPAGKRKTSLMQIAHTIFADDFEGRILAFDADAATHYADIVFSRGKAGSPISMADAQIAAICRSHDAKLATRNLKDFAKTGVDLFNPWD